MRRWLPLVLLGAVLAPWAVADDPPTPADRAQQVQRNYALIKMLVQGSLRLATEDDPVERAEQCLDVADRVVEEIRQAVGQGDVARAVELGEHLQSLMEEGLLANLALGQKQAAPASRKEKKLRELQARALQLLQLAAGEAEGCGHLPQTLRSVHDAVQKVLPSAAQDF